jgi:hypothetical protein
MSTFVVFSQETLTRKIEKSYDMTNAGELHVENKYGNITINGWSKNKIAIAVEVKVINNKEDKAKELFKRIETNFKTTSNFVSVVSEISDKDSGFFARYFNKVNPFEFDRGNVEINVTISLPANAEMEISNKFGDVNIEDWTGKLKANLEHGDLWINESIGNTNIDMTFGKIRAKSMTYGSINLKNGGLDMETSQDLVLKSSGSEIEIDNVTNLELISSKDEVIIGHVGSIHGDLKFSNIEIASVEKDINLYMKVVDFRVLKMVQSDNMVVINQESSDISIDITGLSFKFDAILEEGLLRLPKSFSNVKSNVIDKSKRIRKITASYGKTATGAFSFTGNKGVITLKE